MKIYGKEQKNLTEKEKELLKCDTLIVTSMMMEKYGVRIIGSNFGTDDDLDLRWGQRIKILSELLDIEPPSDTQEEMDEFVGMVEKTNYSLEKFIMVYNTQMNIMSLNLSERMMEMN